MNYQNIKINSEEFNFLSDDDKLKIVKFKLKKLFDEKSKYSVNVIYKGKKVKVSRDKFNNLKNLVSLEKKLETNMNTKVEKRHIIRENTLENEILDFDFVKAINEKKLERESLIEKRRDKNNKFWSFFKEKMYEREINKRNRKRIKRKRISAFICALALTITGFIGFKKNDVKENNVYVPTTRIVMVKSADNNYKNIGSNVIEETSLEDELDLNDKVNIENNAPIYSNSYDAISNNNPATATYDSSYERTIKGVSYELDGKIYTVYQNEIDCDKKVDLLIRSGATLKAVLVSINDMIDDNTYEGYYNVSNVRVRTLINS